MMTKPDTLILSMSPHPIGLLLNRQLIVYQFIMPEPTENLRNTNRTLRILEDAVKGNYGVLAAIWFAFRSIVGASY